jgi:hypothetical protein
MRGRVDRITQHRLKCDGLFVEYVTVRCGILANIEANYGKAAFMSKAMSGKTLNKADVQKLLQMGKSGAAGAKLKQSPVKRRRK